MKRFVNVHRFKKQAFSLIEMAIVLGIIGVSAGGFLTLITSQDEQAKIDTTKFILDQIEESLHSYYQANNRLPCPALKNVASTADAFGHEWDNSTLVGGDNSPLKPCEGAPTQAQITQLHTGTNEEVWIGALPVRELGLPVHYANDAWGSRLTYAIVRDLADIDTIFTDYASGNATRDLILMDKEGTTATMAANRINQTEPAAFVIVAHGKDRNGAYTRNGTVALACDVAAPVPLDSANCDYEGAGTDTERATFRDMAIYDGTAGTAQFFYDYVRWQTPSNLSFKAAAINTGGGSSGGISSSALPVCADTQTIVMTGVGWGCTTFGDGWVSANDSFGALAVGAAFTTWNLAALPAGNPLGTRETLAMLKVECTLACTGASLTEFRVRAATSGEDIHDVGGVSFLALDGGLGNTGYVLTRTSATGSIEMNASPNPTGVPLNVTFIGYID